MRPLRVVGHQPLLGLRARFRQQAHGRALGIWRDVRAEQRLVRGELGGMGVLPDAGHGLGGEVPVELAGAQAVVNTPRLTPSLRVVAAFHRPRCR